MYEKNEATTKGC